MSQARIPAPAAVARPAERAVPPAALVAIVDSSMDGQALLSATLFGLGCRIMAVDCQADSGGAIAVQIRSGRPDVVVWQIGVLEPASNSPLLSLLASGALAGAGVVVVTRAAEEATQLLAAHAVHVVAAPFTAVALMTAVKAAILGRSPSAVPAPPPAPGE